MKSKEQTQSRNREYWATHKEEISLKRKEKAKNLTPEQISKRQQYQRDRYRNLTPEQRAKKIASSRKWQETHREQYLESHRKAQQKAYLADPEKYRERRKNWKENKEKRRLRDQRRRLAIKSNLERLQREREKSRERSRRYKQTHKDKIREYNRKYRSTHCERLRSLLREWRKKNPEKSRNYRKDWEERNYFRRKEYCKKWYKTIKI